MDIERRLRDQFAAGQDALPEPPDRLADIVRRGRRRRTIQNSALGIAGMLVLAGAGLGIRDFPTSRIVFAPAPAPSDAATGGSEAATWAPSPPPTQPPAVANSAEPVHPVAVEDLGAAVLTYGGGQPGLAMHRDDGTQKIPPEASADAIDVALPDGVAGVVAQTGNRIVWYRIALVEEGVAPRPGDPDPHEGQTLVRSDEPLRLRAVLPRLRVVYSVAETRRSEDMVERFYVVDLTEGRVAEQIAAEPLFETGHVGPAQASDSRLVMGSCHLMCSLYEWRPGDEPNGDPLYHGGGDEQGPNAAIEGLTATRGGGMVGFVEYLPMTGMAQPELVLLDGETFQRRASVTLPVDKNLPIGQATVSISSDWQRVLVSLGPVSEESVPQHSFLVERPISASPRIRQVDFEGVVRWLQDGKPAQE